MNYRLKVYISYVIAVCIIYCGLFFAIQINAFSSSFYEKADKELEISSYMGVSSTDYNKSMDTLLSYIQGEKKNINVNVVVDGESTMMFNKKEASHMKDVKALYLSARYVFFGCLAVILLLGAIIYYAQKDEFLGVLATGMKRVGFIFVVGLAVLIFYASVDFTSFWTQFHKTFFTNDLWLLDPISDRMIQMLPEEVFFKLVIRIVFSFSVLFLTLFVSSIGYLKSLRKRILAKEN